jgi:hypothetical protein
MRPLLMMMAIRIWEVRRVWRRFVKTAYAQSYPDSISEPLLLLDGVVGERQWGSGGVELKRRDLEWTDMDDKRSFGDMADEEVDDGVSSGCSSTEVDEGGEMWTKGVEVDMMTVLAK